MTAPGNNFCCATDLAVMSEPGAYGVGIIGIVSYEPNGNHRHAHERRYRCSADSGTTIRLISKLEPTRPVAGIYGNLAFACCEMDEQIGSASETNRLLTGL
jgi:hypothetical protein